MISGPPTPRQDVSLARGEAMFLLELIDRDTRQRSPWDPTMAPMERHAIRELRSRISSALTRMTREDGAA